MTGTAYSPEDALRYLDELLEKDLRCAVSGGTLPNRFCDEKCGLSPSVQKVARAMKVLVEADVAKGQSHLVRLVDVTPEMHNRLPLHPTASQMLVATSAANPLLHHVALRFDLLILQAVPDPEVASMGIMVEHRFSPHTFGMIRAGLDGTCDAWRLSAWIDDREYASHLTGGQSSGITAERSTAMDPLETVGLCAGDMRDLRQYVHEACQNCVQDVRYPKRSSS